MQALQDHPYVGSYCGNSTTQRSAERAALLPRIAFNLSGRSSHLTRDSRHGESSITKTAWTLSKVDFDLSGSLEVYLSLSPKLAALQKITHDGVLSCAEAQLRFLIRQIVVFVVSGRRIDRVFGHEHAVIVHYFDLKRGL
jgi:hypothetical protein